MVLKFVNIQTKEGNVVSFTYLIWHVSSSNWLKINIDGIIKGCLDLTTCVDICKGSQGKYVGVFPTFLKDANFYFY